MVAADPHHPHETVPLAPPASTPHQQSAGRGGVFTPLSRKRPSFTDVEKCCLRALLLDSDTPTSCTAAATTATSDKHDHITSNLGQNASIDENVLFQLPFSSGGAGGGSERTKFGRHPQKIKALWEAHKDGVHTVVMKKRKSSSQLQLDKRASSGYLHDRKQSSSRLSARSAASSGENPQAAGGFSQQKQYDSHIGLSVGGSSFGGGGAAFGMDVDSGRSARCSRASSTSGARSDIESDIEVRPRREHDENSSWGEDDGGFLHYNAWEVLNDEYAEDFGFDFKETIHSIANTLDPCEDDDCQPHVFKILGTSADDVESQPHVLSPPLMDSLLNFVPDSISMENWWLKFSMLRDGASLYTLKQYVKATPYTVLAIETTKGEVFGAFLSHTWKTHPTFFGSAPAFLWRMRHNRRTPCHSLFEQAQLESEIDVYTYSGLNDYVQVCDEGRLAIGGGKLVPDAAMDDGARAYLPNVLQGIAVESLDKGESFGFGIALDANLRSGTTSPCGTFRNPCLINNMSKGEVFGVANLEVWSFTPCIDVKSAERMEMTRFFVEESIRSNSTPSSSYTSDVYASNPFLSQDEFQRDFYRRVGHNQPSGHHRKKSFEHRHVVAPR